jgi:ubiquinol-cytochrome c reductase cytochrome c subunit
MAAATNDPFGAYSGVAGGRELFETRCAQCHGVLGDGGYLGPDLRVPAIAGASPAAIARQVRGVEHMPAFSAAVLPDSAVEELGAYVHETLSRPPEPPGRLGPRSLDPVSLGVIVAGALALFAVALALIFAEGRN